MKNGRGLKELLSELERRKVLRVAAMYAVVALAVIEGADVVVGALNLPEALLQFVVVAALAGFPLALFLAWNYELTARGLQPEKSAEEAEAEMRGSFRSVRPGAIAVFVIAAALLVWRPWRTQADDSLSDLVGQAFVDSVAVLPVENHTGDSTFEYFGAGLADEMINHLKKLGRIKVIDPFSVRRFVDRQLTSDQLADSLGVEKLIHAAVFRDSTQVRVNVRASHGLSNQTLWTRSYTDDAERGYRAAVAIADRFVSDYADRLPGQMRRVSFGHSDHSSGQAAYLLGKSWLGRRTAEGFRRAKAAFAEAIRADSSMAEAYAGLSKAHALTLSYRYRSELAGYREAGRALALADHAVALEPEGAAGYAARGYIATRSYAPVDAVVDDCERTIQLEPGAADGLSWCARVLSQQGEVDVAFRAAERAIDLDPQNAGRRLALAYEALATGRYGRAIEEARAARRIQPELMLPRAIEARALLLSGDLEACLRMKLGPHEGIRAACLHASGDRERATLIVDSIASVVGVESPPDTVFSDVTRAEDLAAYYAWTGDAEQTIAWLDLAFALSPSGVEARVLESDLFSRVRDNPEFRNAVAAIRSQVWARVEREREVAAQLPP